MSTEVKSKVTLFVDHSPESQAVQKVLEESGREVSVIFEAPSEQEVPRWEGPYGVIPGYPNILRYVLTREMAERAREIRESLTAQ